jgi:thiamine transport system permease protein
VLGRNTAVSPVSVPAARKGGVSLAILIILLPFIALVGRAFPSGDFFRGLAAPLGVSLKLAFGSGLLALLSSVCGVYVAQILERRCRWLSLPFSLLLTVPAGISVLVLGLGFWLAYGQWIDPFEGSFLAMLVLQAVVLTPFVFRSLWPVAKAGQPMLLELARTLGASKWRAFSVVEWPRWRAPVLGAFGLSVALSLGEVSAVSLFASDSLTPLSFLVARWMGQYRFDDAQAVALLLFVLSALVVTFVACGGSDE